LVFIRATMRSATTAKIEYRKKDAREPAMKISTNIVMYSFTSFIFVSELGGEEITVSCTLKTISGTTQVELLAANRKRTARQSIGCSAYTVWKTRVRMVHCFTTSPLVRWWYLLLWRHLPLRVFQYQRSVSFEKNVNGPRKVNMSD